MDSFWLLMTNTVGTWCLIVQVDYLDINMSDLVQATCLKFNQMMFLETK